MTRFRAGDEVFGRTRAAIRPDRRDAVATGGCAEYACVSEDVLVPKPGNLTFELAATVPLAALTALQALRLRLRRSSDRWRVSAIVSKRGVATGA